MGWSLGYDDHWKRDIGYGVPAYCDHPGCMAKIDRGLAHVCAEQEPYGGENGCGLYFCGEHSSFERMCECCVAGEGKTFEPTPDHPEWINWKLTDESWQRWRDENPEEVAKLQSGLRLGKQDGQIEKGIV